TGDSLEELAILDLCLEYKMPKDNKDNYIRVYYISINRGIALSNIGVFEKDEASKDMRFPQAEEAFSVALQVAPDSECRCKCLAYQGMEIIRRGNWSDADRAWKCFGQFEREQTSATSPFLQAQVKIGRAALALRRDDLSEARNCCKKALRLNQSEYVA